MRLLRLMGGAKGLKKKPLFIIIFNDKITFKNSNLSYSRLIWSSILSKLLLLFAYYDLGTSKQSWKIKYFIYTPLADFHWNHQRSFWFPTVFHYNKIDMYSFVSQSWCAFWQKTDMLLKMVYCKKSTSEPKPQRKAYHLKDTALLCDF